MNSLEQLKQFTTVVADTGDFKQLAQFQPQDATTNPSLVLKAVRQPEYHSILASVTRQYAFETTAQISDRLLVAFGTEILKIVPGRVSIEVDARLSFDTAKTLQRARQLLSLFDQAGVERSRILIKIAATWEGIQAARELAADGIKTNLTLLFSLAQAAACADANVQLISPFVGRIYDWHKKTAGPQWDESANSGANDPGVKSVIQIYAYYKQHGIATEVMGASFRNVGQVLGLSGCDLMTISPNLLTDLASSDSEVQRRLFNAHDSYPSIERLLIDEPSFRFAMNQDAMATDKLSEGLRQFVADAIALDGLIDTQRLVAA